MHCTVIEEYMNDRISGEEFELHTRECAHCRKLNSRFETAWSELDLSLEVPAGLAERIMAARREMTPSKIRRIDFSLITQVAAVLVAGIFLGITLGKHSNPNLLMSKESRKHQSLVEFRNDHYFNVGKELFY
ncbi:MAG: hypothetical protein ACOYXB_07350 [Bacteroidota bacterium]